MRLYFFIILYAIITHAKQKKEITLTVSERIDVLKHEIAKELKHERKKAKIHIPDLDADDISGKFEYDDLENKPVTPIMDFDDRKITSKFKLPLLRTSTGQSKGTVKSPLRTGKTKAKTKKKRITTLRSQPLEIFYRRQQFDSSKPSPWTHCQDLITPYLANMKANITDAKRITGTDNEVTRLIYLLKINTTNFSKQEVYSIMYQISNEQIRLFHWDVSALSAIMNAITKSTKHTFQSLKHGLKTIFQSWSMDLSNTTNLLKQAKIFRPPCVRITGYEGSTKTSRSSHYTTAQTPQCPEYDTDCKEN